VIHKPGRVRHICSPVYICHSAVSKQLVNLLVINIYIGNYVYQFCSLHYHYTYPISQSTGNQTWRAEIFPFSSMIFPATQLHLVQGFPLPKRMITHHSHYTHDTPYTHYIYMYIYINVCVSSLYPILYPHCIRLYMYMWSNICVCASSLYPILYPHSIAWSLRISSMKYHQFPCWKNDRVWCLKHLHPNRGVSPYPHNTPGQHHIYIYIYIFIVKSMNENAGYTQQFWL